MTTDHILKLNTEIKSPWTTPAEVTVYQELLVSMATQEAQRASMITWCPSGRRAAECRA